MNINKELKEITYYNSLSLKHRKMINYLVFNNYSRNIIPFIIQDLRSDESYLTDDDLFKIFEKQYPNKYKKYNSQINYYKKYRFMNETINK